MTFIWNNQIYKQKLTEKHKSLFLSPSERLFCRNPITIPFLVFVRLESQKTPLNRIVLNYTPPHKTQKQPHSGQIYTTFTLDAFSFFNFSSRQIFNFRFFSLTQFLFFFFFEKWVFAPYTSALTSPRAPRFRFRVSVSILFTRFYFLPLHPEKYAFCVFVY